MGNFARLRATFVGAASLVRRNKWARLGAMLFTAMAVALVVALTQIGPFESPTARIAHAEGPGTGCSGCHASAIAYVDESTCTNCHDGTGATKAGYTFVGGTAPGLTIEMDHHYYAGEPGALTDPLTPTCVDCHEGSVPGDVRYVVKPTGDHTYCMTTECHDQVHDQ